MSTQQRLIQYLTEELLHDFDDLELGGDDPLLTSGLLDSLGVMQFINFIEEELDVSVPPEDITLENFQTINVIAQYLHGRVT